MQRKKNDLQFIIIVKCFELIICGKRFKFSCCTKITESFAGSWVYIQQ